MYHLDIEKSVKDIDTGVLEITIKGVLTAPDGSVTTQTLPKVIWTFEMMYMNQMLADSTRAEMKKNSRVMLRSLMRGYPSGESVVLSPAAVNVLVFD